MKPRFAIPAAAGFGLLRWRTIHRRSVAVQRWLPPTLPAIARRPLYARGGGDGDAVVLLLHGLGATGDSFGAEFDGLAATHRIVVPDLLGFGQSLDETRARFTPEDHLEALEELLHQVDASDGPLIIGAHSMGVALALRFADRHAGRVQRVVCWGAPLYDDHDETQNAITKSGLMARLFVADTAWARGLCRWNCRHRFAAGWVAAAATPMLPIPIARAAALHTWDAYRAAITGLVLGTKWNELLNRLAGHQIPLRFVWGSNDLIGDRALAEAMARSVPSLEVKTVLGAEHYLPISHASACVAHLVDGS